MDPAWIALIGTLCGGLGLKITEHWLSRGKIKVDEASAIRNELRLEVTALRAEIKQLEADVDKWREEYYKARDKLVAMQTELTLALQKLNDKDDKDGRQ